MMTARWRTVLRVRAMLRLLLTDHVPLGAMSRVVELVRRVSDEDLPNEQRVHSASMTGALARDILNELLGDDVELIDRDVPVVVSSFGEAASWHGQREKWRELIEHLRERRAEMKRRADAGDECAGVLHDELQGVLTFIGQQQADPRPPGEPRDLLRIGDELRRRRAEAGRNCAEPPVIRELDELLAFVAPLMGAPLPDVEAFEAYLESEGFYNVMQAYRQASIVPQGEVVAAFEAVKAILRAQVRR